MSRWRNVAYQKHRRLAAADDNRNGAARSPPVLRQADVAAHRQVIGALVCIATVSLLDVRNRGHVKSWMNPRCQQGLIQACRMMFVSRSAADLFEVIMGLRSAPRSLNCVHVRLIGKKFKGLQRISCVRQTEDHLRRGLLKQRPWQRCRRICHDRNAV